MKVITHGEPTTCTPRTTHAGARMTKAQPDEKIGTWHTSNAKAGRATQAEASDAPQPATKGCTEANLSTREEAGPSPDGSSTLHQVEHVEGAPNPVTQKPTHTPWVAMRGT